MYVWMSESDSWPRGKWANGDIQDTLQLLNILS